MKTVTELQEMSMRNVILYVSALQENIRILEDQLMKAMEREHKEVALLRRVEAAVDRGMSRATGKGRRKIGKVTR